MSTPCALCLAVSRDASLPRPACNTHLVETERFVVVPAVGPLLAGHLMIVSREHQPNLLALGLDALTEYEHVADQLRHHKLYMGSGALEAEHGAGEFDPGGTCITHVHVNFVPQLGRETDLFDSKLRLMGTYSRLSEARVLQAPYILLRGDDGRARVFEAKGVPSQLIRRAICARLGRDDWDWAASPRPDVVDETLTLWNAQ